MNDPSKPQVVSNRAQGEGGRGAPSQTRSYIQLKQQGPFSDAVQVGNTLYLSGRIGLDESGKRVPGNIETEARNLMDGIQAVLVKAGMNMNDLVYVQVFCPDVSLWKRFNAIYASYFTDQLPARAFIGSGKLLFDAHFELQGIAIKDR